MVPIVRSRSARLTLGLLLCTAVLAGCRGDIPSSTPAADGAAVDAHFGEPYDVVVQDAEALPEHPPGLSGDTLVVPVGYPGGCADHTFAAEHHARNDTAFVWLAHDGNGDECESYVRDEIRLAAPAGALEAPTVVLMNPRGGPPFVLRWTP